MPLPLLALALAVPPPLAKAFLPSCPLTLLLQLLPFLHSWALLAALLVVLLLVLVPLTMCASLPLRQPLVFRRLAVLGLPQWAPVALPLVVLMGACSCPPAPLRFP